MFTLDFYTICSYIPEIEIVTSPPITSLHDNKESVIREMDALMANEMYHDLMKDQWNTYCEEFNHPPMNSEDDLDFESFLNMIGRNTNNPNDLSFLFHSKDENLQGVFINITLHRVQAKIDILNVMSEA